MGLDTENIEKLRALARLGSTVTVVWGDTGFNRPWNSFCFFGLLNPEKFIENPDCGKITVPSKYKLLVMLEVLNRIGTRATFQTNNRYNTEKREEICWHISPRVLLTVLQLLEQNPKHLEECAKNANDEESFIALTALRDTK